MRFANDDYLDWKPPAPDKDEEVEKAAEAAEKAAEEAELARFLPATDAAAPKQHTAAQHEKVRAYFA